MKTRKGLTFWMNIPSLHQADMITCLGDLWDGPVSIVTEHELYKKRIKQGWTVPDFGKAELLVAPNTATRDAIVATNNCQQSLHVFCGLSAYPNNYKTLKKLRNTPAKIGLFAEGAKSLGLPRTLAKWVNYRRHALVWGSRMDFVMGTGQTAVDWYRKAGFDKSKLFEFGYFVDTFRNEKSKPVSPEAKFRIIYVGVQSKMKGVDILINSLVRISNLPWLSLIHI